MDLPPGLMNHQRSLRLIVVGGCLALKLEGKDNDDDAHFNSKEIEAHEVKRLVLSHLDI